APPRQPPRPPPARTAARSREATQIVDLFHAREHLHDLARSLEFMLGDQKDDWLAARLEDLDYGDIDGICTRAPATTPPPPPPPASRTSTTATSTASATPPGYIPSSA